MSVSDKKATSPFIERVVRKVKKKINQAGKSRKCYICGSTFNHFSKFRGGWAAAPDLFRELDLIGSDLDNYGCYVCGAKDRERHLFMFFDKLNVWPKMKGASIIHFAPELNLSNKIKQQSPLKYVKADLYPKNNTIEKIDATAIPYPDATFDFVIFNHILEHIPDYHKALKELFRVLKPNGIAILQTPYSTILENNFEDRGINTDRLRTIVYGQEDHVRIFSEKQFLKSIKDTGFKLDIVKHNDYFNNQDAFYYGVNKKEDLIRAIKPAV